MIVHWTIAAIQKHHPNWVKVLRSIQQPSNKVLSIRPEQQLQRQGFSMHKKRQNLHDCHHRFFRPSFDLISKNFCAKVAFTPSIEDAAAVVLVVVVVVAIHPFRRSTNAGTMSDV